MSVTRHKRKNIKKIVMKEKCGVRKVNEVGSKMVKNMSKNTIQ